VNPLDHANGQVLSGKDRNDREQRGHSDAHGQNLNLNPTSMRRMSSTLVTL
jgi:hypothetical protein